MGWKQGMHGLVVYVPEHFALYEFFPPDLKPLFDIGDVHNANIVWLYMDPRVTVTADRLRKRYGTAIMNTWGLSEKSRELYGTHQWRGWRPRNCPVGAELSQHKMGTAADMAFVHVSAEAIREDILNDPFNETFEYITAIEMSVSWLHFDVRPWDKANNGIQQFYP